MANYSYTNSGIDFTLQDNDILQFRKISNGDGSFNHGEIVPLINAVEIDWNGATTTMGDASKVINTTGELISYLATA
jgi:hypothetical protein